MHVALPLEVWLAIARAGGPEADEYVFNTLARAIPSVGKWSIRGTDGEIISRRLDMMCTFGYDVRIAQYCPKIRFECDWHKGYNKYVTYKKVYCHLSRGLCEFTVWYKNGRIHRNDGPAVIHDDVLGYYKHEVPHRVDGPAIQCFNSRSERWWMNGKLHRVDGPAVIENDYCTQWWRDGELHRIAGPADISTDSRTWYVHGECHRIDSGPTHISTEVLEWWHRGELHNPYGPAVVRYDGTSVWFEHGKRHRNEGPAVVYNDGYCAYWKHGILIDVDRPSVQGGDPAHGDTHSIYGVVSCSNRGVSDMLTPADRGENSTIEWHLARKQRLKIRKEYSQRKKDDVRADAAATTQRELPVENDHRRARCTHLYQDMIIPLLYDGLLLVALLCLYMLTSARVNN